MNNEQLQSAKDEAAMELTFPNFDYVKKLSLSGKVSIETLDVIYTRAMEIYAEMVNGWVSVEDKPLFTTDENGNWTCTDDGEGYFLAAVELSDGSWWIKYCTVEDGIGLCTIGEDDNEPSGFELSDITHYKKVSPPKTTKP